MKILQIGNGSVRMPPEKGGGAEKAIFEVSEIIAKAGHEVAILDRRYDKTDPASEYKDGVRIIRLKAKIFSLSTLGKIKGIARFIYLVRFVLNEISFALKTRRYLGKRSDFDVIHIHYPLMGLIVSVRNRQIVSKLIYTSHLDTWLSDPHSLSIVYKFYMILESYVMRHARKVIALNEPMRTKFITRGKVKPENIATLRNGVDIDAFNPDINVGDIKERYGLNGRFNILFVGRITEFKGIEYLVRAANIIVNDFNYKHALFTLVGPFKGFGMSESMPDKYVGKIFQLIEGFKLEENIKLVGAVSLDDLRKLYTACDVFVLPSLAEADPVVSLQAMACGKPVIATRVGGLPAQIEDGRSGFLVEPASERELAERIKYLIDSPGEAKRMGENGRRLAVERFDWEVITKGLLQVYQTERNRQ